MLSEYIQKQLQQFYTSTYIVKVGTYHTFTVLNQCFFLLFLNPTIKALFARGEMSVWSDLVHKFIMYKGRRGFAWLQGWNWVQKGKKYLKCYKKRKLNITDVSESLWVDACVSCDQQLCRCSVSWSFGSRIFPHALVGTRTRRLKFGREAKCVWGFCLLHMLKRSIVYSLNHTTNNASEPV